VRTQTKEQEQSPDITETQLLKALAHPLRWRILAALNERVASPVELSREFGEPIGNVSYHVRTLDQLGLLELVSTTPRRGAVEHHYRATRRAFFSKEQWARLPASVRQRLSEGVVRDTMDDLLRSTAEGVFDRRPDVHLSWTPIVVDEEGWEQINEVLAEALDRVMDIQAASVGRNVEREPAEREENFGRVALLQYLAAERVSKPRER